MPEHKNIPAEEKLLRLIKNTKQDASQDKREKNPLRSVIFKNLISSKRSLDYLFISLYFIFFSLFLSQLLIKNKLFKPQMPSLKGQVKTDYNISIPSIGQIELLQNINQRQLFSASFVSNDEPNKVPITEINSLIKDLSLVGIVFKQNKFVAIIEDRRANKTYFLNEADTLGELAIKHIEEGKVILEYNGQEISLHL